MDNAPDILEDAEVFITAKTYPNLSRTHGELVCTAGLLKNGEWVRIYPLPFRYMEDYEKFSKYQWIKISLRKNREDFRPESYRPIQKENKRLEVLEKVGTENNWIKRKKLVLQDVSGSMSDLIECAKSDERKSLGIIQPKEITGFKIEETEREWSEERLHYFREEKLFEETPEPTLKKLPYIYSYSFLTEGDDSPRTLMIEDWEIGMLYWNCLEQVNGNEEEANNKVKEKYSETFVQEKDLYFIVGTTKANHLKAKNPFIIIGVFYPPKDGGESGLFS